MTLIHNGRALPKVQFPTDCGAWLPGALAVLWFGSWASFRGGYGWPGTPIGIFRAMSVMLDLAAFTGLRFGKPDGIL